MTVDREEVRAVFSLYSGEDLSAGDERAALCLRLCEDCAARTETLLARADGEELAPYESALESWTAAQAFYQLALADEASGPQSLSADGVKIEEGERAQKAKRLAEEKRKAVLPLLGEEAFCFVGV